MKASHFSFRRSSYECESRCFRQKTLLVCEHTLYRDQYFTKGSLRGGCIAPCDLYNRAPLNPNPSMNNTCSRNSRRMQNTGQSFLFRDVHSGHPARSASTPWLTPQRCYSHRQGANAHQFELKPCIVVGFGLAGVKGLPEISPITLRVWPITDLFCSFAASFTSLGGPCCPP